MIPCSNCGQAIIADPIYPFIHKDTGRLHCDLDDLTSDFARDTKRAGKPLYVACPDAPNDDL
jgi:hypothetical protein